MLPPLLNLIPGLNILDQLFNGGNKPKEEVHAQGVGNGPGLSDTPI